MSPSDNPSSSAPFNKVILVVARIIKGHIRLLDTAVCVPYGIKGLFGRAVMRGSLGNRGGRYLMMVHMDRAYLVEGGCEEGQAQVRTVRSFLKFPSFLAILYFAKPLLYDSIAQNTTVIFFNYYYY